VVNNNSAITSGVTGNYSMNYNFGSRVGVTNMTFDNTAYRGTVSGNNPSGTNFSGGFAGARGTGTMNGQFYGPGAANQGGTFTIGTKSTPYQAVGIFGGQR